MLDCQMTSLEDRLRLKGMLYVLMTLTNRIQTPLRVSHSLVMEVWFSVTGEDEWGNACEEHKTRARTLTLRKAVMIPSVGSALLIPRKELTSVCTNPRVCGSPNMCVICTRSFALADF